MQKYIAEFIGTFTSGAGSAAMSQVWLHFLAPCLGAVRAGAPYRVGLTREPVPA